MVHRFSLEKRMRVYNNDTGDYVEVTEDSDSLGLVSIHQSETKTTITMSVEQARILYGAMREVCDFIDATARQAKDPSLRDL